MAAEGEGRPGWSSPRVRSKTVYPEGSILLKRRIPDRSLILILGWLAAASCGDALADSAGTPAPRDGYDHAVYYLEIVTPDVEKTARFYTEAHGWRFAPAAPELGGAVVAELPDGSLCGIRAPMHAGEKPVVRPYLRVPDIEEAVRQAQELGAVIAVEPMDIPGRGRIAIYFLDDIEQGVWELP